MQILRRRYWMFTLFFLLSFFLHTIPSMSVLLQLRRRKRKKKEKKKKKRWISGRRWDALHWEMLTLVMCLCRPWGGWIRAIKQITAACLLCVERKKKKKKKQRRVHGNQLSFTFTNRFMSCAWSRQVFLVSLVRLLLCLLLLAPLLLAMLSSELERTRCIRCPFHPSFSLSLHIIASPDQAHCVVWVMRSGIR